MNENMKKCFYILFLFLSMPLWAQAQTRRASIPLQHGAHRIGNRTDADMERWRQHGLGQFIHWGVYAIPGGFWEGKWLSRSCRMDTLVERNA